MLKSKRIIFSIDGQQELASQATTKPFSSSPNWYYFSLY
jgi:hypothetical protein